MASRIHLAIAWLSVPKRGRREEASTISGPGSPERSLGPDYVSHFYAFLCSITNLSNVYRLALSDQDQAICTRETVKIFSRSVRAWRPENIFSLGPERALGGPSYCITDPI